MRDTKRLALALVASPAIVVAYLFIVRPEALGSPAMKLGLMTLAGCLLMAMGELSDALVRWAAPRMRSRASEAAPGRTMLDVLTLSPAPESTRFG